MRVLYFHQHFNTPQGSVGVRSYQMAKRLIASGHTVTMVCGSYIGGETGLSSPFVNGIRRGEVEGIQVVELDLQYSNSDRFVRRAITFCKFAIRSIRIALTEPCDLVFATTTPLTAGIPGIAARWLRGKPFVFEVRDLWPELPRAMGVIKNPAVLALLALLEWLSYRSADRLVGLAPGIVDGIVAKGVDRANVHFIPNGCDVDIFGASADLWRPEGVRSGDFLAVYAGTFGIANAVDSVLDAAFELKRRGRNDIKILLIGQGKLETSLKDRVDRQTLSNVLFHKPVNKAKLAGLLSSTDLGLQLLANIPAFYNGTSPNKFFDYLASGLPVLCNYPGWVANLVEESSCGFAVRPDDPGAFADALEAAANDRRELIEMGERSLALAMRKFDRQVLAVEFVKFLEQAAAVRTVS